MEASLSDSTFALIIGAAAALGLALLIGLAIFLVYRHKAARAKKVALDAARSQRQAVEQSIIVSESEMTLMNPNAQNWIWPTQREWFVLSLTITNA